MIHRDNLAVVRKVCSLVAGITKETCAGVLEAVNGKGDILVRRRTTHDRTIFFIDAFSANDIESTQLLQRRWLKEELCPRPFIALMNHRADRPLRMLSFATFIAGASAYDYIFLVGDGQWLAKKHIQRRGRTDNVFRLTGQEPERWMEEICGRVSGKAFTILGMGNYKGPGEKLIRFFLPEEISENASSPAGRG